MAGNTFNNLMGLPDIQAMMESAQAKTAKMSRLDDLVDVARFIDGASLLECKHIINSLVRPGVVAGGQRQRIGGCLRRAHEGNQL